MRAIFGLKREIGLIQLSINKRIIMEQKYYTPKCEVIETRLEGIMASSNEDQGDGGDA